MNTHAGTTQNAGSRPQVERLGRYRLLGRLGQGGMGTIHLAVAGGLADFRKLLVVKELRPELTSNEHFVQMFLAEAKVAARLQHPNIVQTLEAGQDGERYFLAMEFLDGQPLSELLKRAAHEPLAPLGMRIGVLCEVLSGLHYAHELCDFDDTPFQIVHRDVNPQNVFITYHGHVKLVDFGIAKVVDSELCTTAGVFKGKFPYAAPEQVDCRPVDRRADLFAVGVMLWEILAQRRFAPGQPTMQGIDARLAGSEPRIAEALPSVDPELAAICDRAMQVDPELRYATAEAFRADLHAYLSARNELATAAALGELLRAKFDTERATVHRLITTQVRQLVPDEELGDSLVRVLTRGVTTKPGLSDESGSDSGAGSQRTARERPSASRQRELPIASQSQRLILQRKRRQARKWRAAGLAAAALLAFGGAYLWVRRQTTVPHAPLPPMAASPGVPLQAASPAPPSAASSAAPPSAAPSWASPSAGPSSASTSAAASSDLPSASRGLVPPSAASSLAPPRQPPIAAVAAAQQASATATTNPSPTNRTPTKPVHAPPGNRAAGPRPASGKPLSAAPEPRAQSSGRGEVAAGRSNGAAQNQRPLEAGDDMRLLRRARATPSRTLEDPFQ